MLIFQKLKELQMRQLITASRIGLKSSLNWLVQVNGVIVSVILNDGPELQVESQSDLEKFYNENKGPVPLNEYFKNYNFSKVKALKDKTMSEILKSEEKRFIDIKLSSDTNIEDSKGIPEPMEVASNDFKEVGLEKNDNESKSSEIIWRLIMYRNKEASMIMEFEAEEDLASVYLKWKETNPSCIFKKQRIESNVYSIVL